MGEEKPDEELMGKRKSSPRLSPAPLGAGNIILLLRGGKYTCLRKKIARQGPDSGEAGSARLLQSTGMW
uniref:Uncharacterized protein n=1 Tax=Cohnella candidum TaxID=2674991 RepID=A0A3G3JUL9_9BACL|nr:hypothetical protein EAV92_04765 [Cohnella candidum]